MVRLIFLFLIIPSICFSEIKGFIELGKDIDYNIAYTELQIGFEYKWFYFYGNQQTWFEYFFDGYGRPFRDVYTTGIDAKYKNFILNLSHFCSHEVTSKASSFAKNYMPPRDGLMTKISIRYEF